MGLMRREFLSNLTSSLGVVPFLAMSSPSSWGSLLFEPEGNLVPPKPLLPNPFQKNGKALVALIYGHDPNQMIREGIDVLGGIMKLGLNGKRVLIKPNVVNGRPPPSTTSLQVIAATTQVIREAGAIEITVADSSGVIRFPTSENLVKTGIRKVAENAGAKVLALEDEPWLRVEPKQAKFLSRYFVSKPVYEADVVINLPVVKTHRFANYSCSLKNAVGIVHPRNRPSVTFLAGNWHERIAELNLAVHPLLTIADGTTMMIAGGPTSGTPAQANVVILSGDRVALDVVAVAIIRSYKSWSKVMDRGIWEQRQIKRAAELGLGINSSDQIELVPHSISGPNLAFTKLVEAVRLDLQI